MLNIGFESAKSATVLNNEDWPWTLSSQKHAEVNITLMLVCHLAIWSSCGKLKSQTSSDTFFAAAKHICWDSWASFCAWNHCAESRVAENGIKGPIRKRKRSFLETEKVETVEWLFYSSHHAIVASSRADRTLDEFNSSMRPPCSL